MEQIKRILLQNIFFINVFSAEQLFINSPLLKMLITKIANSIVALKCKLLHRIFLFVILVLL